MTWALLALAWCALVLVIALPPWDRWVDAAGERLSVRRAQASSTLGITRRRRRKP